MKNIILTICVFFQTTVQIPVLSNGSGQEAQAEVNKKASNTENTDVEKETESAQTTGSAEDCIVEKNSKEFDGVTIKKIEQKDYQSLFANNLVNLIIPFRERGSVMSKLEMDTCALLEEREAEIFKGTAYEGTDQRMTDLARGGESTGDGGMSPGELISPSWFIIAIYSFKNDQARDCLFDFITTDPKEQWVNFSFWATYFITLFPNSGDLLPKAKILLDEQIANIRQNNPGWAKRVINEKNEVIYPFAYSDYIHPSDPAAPYIFQLARLVRALEFNEKMPVEERESF